MIITDNEELLRVKCEDVLPEEIGPLREALEAELNYSIKMGRFGIGLAAPQIGIAKKMSIIRLGSKDLEVDLVNCQIEKGYDQIIHRDEGCLSFPGRIENVLRNQEVYIAGNLVYPQTMILTGLMAICAQHELDHVNGILLPDRALVKPKVKAGPNNPCPCGKIDPNTNKVKKYKKCCGK